MRSARGKIIAAARLEFMAIGRAAATIESIAARACLTRQLVYYYYKDKDEIFFDIVIREAQSLFDRFENLDVEHRAPEEVIRELLLRLRDYANETPILSAYMVDTISRPSSDKKAAIIYTNMMQQIAKRLQTLLDRGAEQGNLRPGVNAARFFSAACMLTSGARHRHALGMMCGLDLTDEKDINSWQQFAVDLLMRSICQRRTKIASGGRSKSASHSRLARSKPATFDLLPWSNDPT
jgi:AcrR family transcriptional regulator